MSTRFLNYPPPQPEEDLGSDPLPADETVMPTKRTGNDYMTSSEAAEYLRRSKSFLVRQPDIPYLPGHPNTYSKRDLDEWFERHKKQPRIR